MLFNRQLTKQLNHWKTKPKRKPLIIRGARQVGKTTLIKEFAKTYRYSIYLNLETSKHRHFFDETDNIKTIVDAIFIAHNIATKYIKDSLIFIDEIQESPKAIALLRYFYEEFPQLHVISAGSLLEFALKDVSSFPVGRIEFLYLYPLNFQEFLDATDHKIALEQLTNNQINPAAHSTLIQLFNQFCIIGGMPEIIGEFIQEQSFGNLAHIYESLWASYISDTEKYARNTTEKNVIRHIMATAAYSIDKRIKFQNFGNSNYRSREMGEAFRNLHQARIIQLMYPTTALEPPIIADLKKSPKLQFLDTGLLNYTLDLSSQMLLLDDLSSIYKGSIIPHMITQELISLQSHKSQMPCFWVREKRQASSEVDLVYSIENKVIPIEIKSGSSGSLKSLHQFVERSNHPYAVRMYAGKFEISRTKTPNGKPYILMNLPYYLGTQLPKHLTRFINQHKKV